MLNTLLGRRRSARKGKKKVRRTQRRRTPRRERAPYSASESHEDKMQYDKLDVRGAADVPKLLKLLKNNKIVVVLIYADWCGHCQVYKKEVWEPLSGMANRKVPIAAVNEKALQQTPFANAKIDGYPSVTVAGQDGSLAEFQSETGEPTNALPNSRNMNDMEKLVTADPEVVLNNVAASGPTPPPLEENVAEEEEPRSVQPTMAAEEQLNNAGEEAVNNLANASLPPANVNANASLSKVVSNPPDPEDDLATEAAPLDSLGLTVQPSGPAAAASGAQAGGSLYYALLQAAREAAPAAILAGTAMYAEKRGSRKGGRGGSKGRGRTARKLRR